MANNSNWLNGLGTAVGIGGNLLGMFSGNTNQKRQYGQQKELMDLQNKYQRELNQQGADLQFDMWNKTNYGAQLEHMKSAGLNPALMYGMGGGGGSTTGNQGGGNQSMGGVEQQKNMGIEGAMAMAQLELMKSQANKLEAEASSIRGEEGTKGASEIAKLIQETGTEAERTKLTRIQTLVEQAKETTEKAKANNIKIDSDLKSKQLEIAEQERLIKKYEVELNAIGIQKDDNKIFRYLTKLADDLGFDVITYLKMLKKDNIIPIKQ